MAIVIHTIKGNQYAYDHQREGGKVVSDYIGPVGSGSTNKSYTTRAAMHGGGRTGKQREVKPEVKEPAKVEEKTQEKVINTNRHNIDIADKESKKMEYEETRQIVEAKEYWNNVLAEKDDHNTEIANSVLAHVSKIEKAEKEYTYERTRRSWEAEYIEVQTKKINHQYTKVKTEEEKNKKRQVQAAYDKKLKQIRLIEDLHAELRTLERESIKKLY